MKIKRKIDEAKLAASEEKLVYNVFERIEKSEKKRNILLRPSFRFVTVLTLAIILLSVLISGNNNPPTYEQPQLTEYDTAKIAELSYLSGSLIGSNLNVYDEQLMFLATTDETEFEANQDQINMYFDMLRVYLNGDLSDMVSVEQLIDSEYHYRILFEEENKTFTFLLKMDGNDLQGILQISAVTFTVAGSYEKGEDETKLKLEAYDGDNFVKISYRYEKEDEIESRYEIESRINGVTSQKEIRTKFFTR